MKKFTVLLMVLIVLGGVGFAEVAVTGQVDAVVMPLEVIAPDGGDAQIGAAVGRNGSTALPRARIGVAAGTEEVGINFKVQFFAGGTLGIDDFAEVWWKPISPLKIEAGKFVNDTLRGKIGDDNWNKYTVVMKDADGIFSRFKSNWSGTVGFMLGINPIEPLYIGVSVPGIDQLASAAGASGPDKIGTYTIDYEWDDGTPKAEDKTLGNVLHTYEKIQAGVGYTIANIGLVRAQYVGASYIFSEADVSSPATWAWWKNPLNNRRIEAAFAFTGMSGLVIDVGGKLPLNFDTYEVKDYTVSSDKKYVRVIGGPKFLPPLQVSLGAGYTLDALDIKARVDAQFLGSAENEGKWGSKYTYTLGPDINFHLWPSYNLGFATAGLDVGFNFIGESKMDYETETATEVDTTYKGGYQFGIGAWLRKAYGGASIKGGLALSLGEVNEKKLDTVFSVPIIFDYTF